MSLNLYSCLQAHESQADLGCLDDIANINTQNQIAAVGVGSSKSAAISDAIDNLVSIGAVVRPEDKLQIAAAASERSIVIPGQHFYAIVEFYNDRDSWGQV